MYYYLLSALKRRMVLELQDSFSRHPVYAKIVPFIQNKYAFDERPQYGIVVKGSSANKVSLSADNFVGYVSSHVMLAFVGEPAYPIEWVREDVGVVEANHNIMPTSPGIYYIEILTVPTNATEEGTYAIDPLLTQYDEPVLRFISGIEHEAQLQRVPVPGTVRLWLDKRILLTEGQEYTVNYEDGSLRLSGNYSPDAVLTADYRYVVDSLGPIPFQWNMADFKTLPGIVMAFGKRAKVGDKVALVVTPDRVDTAQAFGGRFDVSFDFDVISQDPMQMEEMADLVLMYLWGQKRPGLSTEGIEIVDVNIGGEAEETYDEQAELFFYTASMQLQLQADWEIHIPLPLTISRAQATTPSGRNALIATNSNLYFATTPVMVGRNSNFERIS